MALTQTTTHVAEAKARLVEQFKAKPKLEGLLAAYVTQVQELEDVFFQLLLDRVIGTAIGVQLDGLGAIVGEERKGKNDTSYRIWIRGRIKANRSSGTPEQMLEIADLITDANALAIEEYYPAGFNLIIYDDLVENLADVAAILDAASPAGVNAQMEYRLSAEALTFSFASGDAIEVSATQGFAESGEEFVINGDFAAWAGGDPVSWTVDERLPNSEVSEVGAGLGHGGGGNGLCNLYSSDGTVVRLIQVFTIIPGASYTLQFLIDTFTDDTAELKVYDSDGKFSQVFTTIGVKTINFTPTATPTILYLVQSKVASLDVTIDNVSLTVAGVGGKWAGAEEI